MEYTIEIVRSNRKSIGLEIKEAGKLLVRAPYRATEKEIFGVIESHQNWIEKYMHVVAEKQEHAAEVHKYTLEEIQQMAEEALKVIPPKVEKYAKMLGVTYGRITIRNQKTRWGSCSAKGNLNFNCLLMKAPEEVMDYVIVHELCHRIEMNHSKKFWDLVEQMMPDYRERREWLKKRG